MLKALYDEEKDKAKADQSKLSALQNALKSSDKIETLKCHQEPIENLYTSLTTTPEKGLSLSIATSRLKAEGPNQLKEKKQLPWIVRLLKEMVGIFSDLLWVGAILSFIAYGLDTSDKSNLYLGIVIAIINLVTGFFSFYQNNKSTAIMAKFKNFIPQQSKVIRDGTDKSINASELVRGDIVLIKIGESVPADIRIISSSEMKVDNSSLTGESEPLLRSNKMTSDHILQTSNMVFFGTKCISGEAKGIVVLTGQNTIIGLIANLAQNATIGESTLRNELNRFIKIISFIAVGIGILFFVVGMILKPNWILNFIYMIGIIVANVPEGLLATVTVSLSLAAKSLAAKNVLVKNLESLETLGCTSCICTDKTGTLTQNKMKVSHAFLNLEEIDCTLNYQDVELKGGHPHYNIEDKQFDFMVQSICLSTAAKFKEDYFLDADIRKEISKMLKKDPEKVTNEEMEKQSEIVRKKLITSEISKPWLERHVEGDASETGLIKFAQPIKDVNKERELYAVPQINSKNAEIPFNSSNKFNMIIRRVGKPDGSFCNYRIYMKGAPERIWGKCCTLYMNGEISELKDDILKQLKNANFKFGSYGERVLGFAYKNLDPTQFPEGYPFDCESDKLNFPFKELTFLSLVSLIDPLREDVPDAVLTCRDGGIKVIMVTGDQPVTAMNIATQCHIITDQTKEMFTLMEKEHISEEEALNKAQSIVVNGELLAKRHLEDYQKSDSDPTKGLFLRKWLTIKEVVFARTNPAQKLQIVDACQKLNHIVAATGDGVNDSPAIKKANIGIAMGSGCDIARDAADMILLTDDFSSILLGVKQGRVIFDNLKKSIAYTLISNIPELVPFLLLIIIQVPLPLTTILMLCVDVGTDLLPAIAFAYETAESDLMKKGPRNHQLDHLVNARLVSTAYMQLGMVEAMAGAFTYFAVMAEFGYKPMTLLFLNFRLGNCSPTSTKGNSFDWSKYNCTQNATTFYNCPNKSLKASDFYSYNEISHELSSETHIEIAYTSEALKYAQTATFVSIIMMQWTDYICLRSNAESTLTRRIVTWFQPFALLFETALLCFLVYTPGVNTAFGTRRIPFRHWLYSCPFVFLFLLYEEIKKLIIREMKCSYHKYNWMARNVKI